MTGVEPKNVVEQRTSVALVHMGAFPWTVPLERCPAHYQPITTVGKQLCDARLDVGPGVLGLPVERDSDIARVRGHVGEPPWMAPCLVVHGRAPVPRPRRRVLDSPSRPTCPAQRRLPH